MKNPSGQTKPERCQMCGGRMEMAYEIRYDKEGSLILDSPAAWICKECCGRVSV